VRLTRRYPSLATPSLPRADLLPAAVEGVGAPSMPVVREQATGAGLWGAARVWETAPRCQRRVKVDPLATGGFDYTGSGFTRR